MKMIFVVLAAATAGAYDCGGGTGVTTVATYDCKSKVRQIPRTPYGYDIKLHVSEMSNGQFVTTVTSTRNDGQVESLDCANTSGDCSTRSWAWQFSADHALAGQPSSFVHGKEGLFATAQYVNPDTFNGQKYVVSCVKTEGVNLY